MSWQSARASAALLAERLKVLDKARTAGFIERRKKPRDEGSAADRSPAPQPVYVKPSRTIEVAPAAASQLPVIDDDLADLIEIEHPIPEAPERLGHAAEEVVAEADDTPESRRAPRKSHMIPAYLTGPEIANIVPARVVDMSATGAKVELTPMGRATGVPLTDLGERFTLVLRLDRMEVDCELIWREEWMIGVRFLGFPRPIQAASRR